MKKRIFAILGGLLIVVVVGGYFAVSSIVYNRLATVLPKCAGEFATHTPSEFSADRFLEGMDVSSYFMPSYEEVSIASRQPGITLSAWFVPSEESDAPTILITHGLGVGTPDCKRHPRALIPAGMLHNAGYNVLLIDLREHGDSTIEDGYWAGNTEEYLDVLGAFDWLVDTRGTAPEDIGLFGYSGGTGATIIAMGQDQRIGVAWLDSVYLDFQVALADRLVSDGFPAFLAPGGLFFARLQGDDMFAISPLAVIDHIGDRPVFITHITGDQTLLVSYARDMDAALRAAGTPSELWIIEGEGHVRGMFDQPDEYERRLIDFFDANLRS